MKDFCRRNRFDRMLIPVCFAIAGASSLPAQTLASLGGVVTDSAGNLLSGATVSIASLSLKVMTNEAGEFRFHSVQSGSVRLAIRRLGYSPVDRDMQVAAPGESAGKLHIRLAALPTTLKPVLVSSSTGEFSGRLAGYYTRLQRRSSGYFIARDEIDKQGYRTLSQILKNVPGINAFDLRSGGSAVRMRQRDCRPLVWLDGVPMPAGEVDLDAFPVSTFHGIELYLGSTTAPADFTANSGLSSCGTILLWSRGADTDPPRRFKKAAVNLEALVESLSVFTASQVDQQAEPSNRGSVSVNYPPDLFASKIPGSVVAEFVVDQKGVVETRTISIVTSTDFRFSEAVQQGLEKLKFNPAVKNGAVVRQIVQMPFEFAPGLRDVGQSNK